MKLIKMEEKIKLSTLDPEVIRDISDRLSKELPVDRVVRRNINKYNEEREITLKNGQKIKADIDPEIEFDRNLF